MASAAAIVTRPDCVVSWKLNVMVCAAIASLSSVTAGPNATSKVSGWIASRVIRFAVGPLGLAMMSSVRVPDPSLVSGSRTV